jgi:hypothetical protein
MALMKGKTPIQAESFNNGERDSSHKLDSSSLRVFSFTTRVFRTTTIELGFDPSISTSAKAEFRTQRIVFVRLPMIVRIVRIGATTESIVVTAETIVCVSETIVSNRIQVVGDRAVAIFVSETIVSITETIVSGTQTIVCKAATIISNTNTRVVRTDTIVSDVETITFNRSPIN